MKSIALANPQALFAYAMGVESSHICFLYTWSRQGSCGVVPGQLLVFPIAPLNLWTTRDPRTSHDTPSEGKEARETTEQPFVVPTCGCCPTTTTRVQAKGVTTANTLVLYIPSSSTSRAITTMLTSGKQRRALKPINYYYRLCKEKRKVVTIVFFFLLLLLSYINWDFCLFVLIETGFSIQWPNAYLLVAHVKFSFIKTVISWSKQWINLWMKWSASCVLFVCGAVRKNLNWKHLKTHYNWPECTEVTVLM